MKPAMTPETMLSTITAPVSQRVSELVSELVPRDDRSNLDLMESVHPASWRNPTPRAKYDLVILGGGPAGMLAAYKAADLDAKVALVERNLLGGECLNTGCIPSKTIIRTSRLYAEMRDAENYGARVPGGVHADFPFVMERVRRIRARIGRLGSARQLGAAGVDVFFGEGHFAGPDRVMVGDTRLRFKKALITTGSRPIILPIPGLVEAGYLTNQNIFDLTESPRRILVIGGGPLGCELAQAFCRLGSQVAIVQKEPMFLRQEERDAAQILSDAMTRDGIQIHLNTEVVRVRVEGTEKVIELVRDGDKSSVVVDEIVLGAGRTPNVETLNLEAVGVKYDTENGIRINDFLRTTNRRIYAAGDVCFEHKFTHIEDASAGMVVQNALFWGRKRLSDLTIPWCTYTDPEIAHVGLYVREAREKGIKVKTFTVLMHDVHRAIADGEEEGFVKIHVKRGTDKILGATVVARHAGEMINDLSMAIKMGIGLGSLAQVIHPYPTQAQAIQMAADAYAATRARSTYNKRIGKWLLRKWLAW